MKKVRILRYHIENNSFPPCYVFFLLTQLIYFTPQNHTNLINILLGITSIHKDA